MLFTFLLLILGMIDLTLYQLRANILAEAARQGARLAIIHGSISPRPSGVASWGPAKVGPSHADSGAAPIQAIKQFLYGIDPSTVTVTYTWLDAGNDPQSQNRVQVEVDGSYRPMMTFLFTGSIPIKSTSTMVIAH